MAARKREPTVTEDSVADRGGAKRCRLPILSLVDTPRAEAFAHKPRTDRLADFSHASSGPAWNRYCQFGFSTLALVFAVLEAVSAIMPVNTAAVRSPLGQSGLIIWTGSWSSATFALQITASVVIWCLYAGYAAWMILVGRRLGQIGRRGAHYRLLAVRMLWVMPLFLCATNLFVNDYSPVSLTDARRDLVFACGVRVLLGLIVAYLGVRVRRATDRLLTPAP
jgi:hypothetical protein